MLNEVKEEADLLWRALAVLRQSIAMHQWDVLGGAIAKNRSQHEIALQKLPHEVDMTLGSDSLDAFRTNGLLPLALAPEMVKDMKSWLETMPVLASMAHGERNLDFQPLSEVRKTSSFAGYKRNQLLAAPGIVDLVNHPMIVDFVERFLGCVPTLYALHAWWSFPASAPEGLTAQYF